MKKSILTLVFMLAISPAVFAQVKPIEARDFYQSDSNAYRLMNERSRRVVTKTETFSNGGVETSTTIINERLLPDKWRFYRVEKKGTQEESIETIIIGSTEYSRKNNGQWMVRQLDNGTGSGMGIGGGSICIQYTEESDFISGVSARKLRALTITSPDKSLMFDDFINWFDQQGLLLRSERIKGFFEPRLETSRSVTVYEYDPADLKIEAPVK